MDKNKAIPQGYILDDIKNRLIPLDTPAEIAAVLAEQTAAVRQKIESLSESLRELEGLREEVLQMQSVNFKKYADIIVNLQMKNDFYWLIKHFDDQTLDHIRSRFDKDSLRVWTPNGKRSKNSPKIISGRHLRVTCPGQALTCFRRIQNERGCLPFHFYCGITRHSQHNWPGGKRPDENLHVFHYCFSALNHALWNYVPG